jgi:ABC-2 type transport system permease protein
MTAKTRPFYWSVRRELWENRSIYLAPVATAGFLLLLSLAGILILSFIGGDMSGHPADAPYDIAGRIITFAAFLAAFFYCLDALHGERRDRSMLFWKSLPVSDRTTVLAKATVPLVVLPVVTYAIIVVLQLLLKLIMTTVFAINGLRAAPVSLLEPSLTLGFTMVALTLWNAPLYAWVLLVSGWAKRAAFLWAVLPVLGVSVLQATILEVLAESGFPMNPSRFDAFLQYRFSGLYEAKIGVDAEGRLVTTMLHEITPLEFFTMPRLWFGLALAALFLVAAIRQRRSRDPI